MKATTANAKPGSSGPDRIAGSPGSVAGGGALGVYIHVPWCRQLCPYCDFAVAMVGRAPIPHQRYLDAVLAELTERAPEVAGRRLVSIYFGGGTPSLWQPACLEAVVTAVKQVFAPDLAAELEVTLEANPQDCVPDRLAAWRAAGIDRLSIGVQSLEPEVLRALGRSALGDGPAALSAAAAAGFRRVSADLIFGVPRGARGGGDVPGAAGALDRSVAALADTGVGHLSVYELTIEDRTAFGKAVRAGRMAPLDDQQGSAARKHQHRC